MLKERLRVVYDDMLEERLRVVYDGMLDNPELIQKTVSLPWYKLYITNQTEFVSRSTSGEVGKGLCNHSRKVTLCSA